MRYGYFDESMREYVIERPDTPVSWINYLGFKDYCGIISNNAGGYSFHKDSVRNRLLRMRFNSIPMDRPGRYLYIKDRESEDYWSISWQPVGKELKEYRNECRHGLGYSKFSSQYAGIQAKFVNFVPVDDPCEIWDVEIRNESGKKRELSLFSYAEFCFWKVDQEFNLQYVLYTARPSYEDGIIGYHTFFSPIDQRHAYMFMTETPLAFDTNRESFIGPYRSESNPVAVEKGCTNSLKSGWNPCAAFQWDFVLEPGEVRKVSLVLGIGPAASEGKKIREKYRNPEKVKAAFNVLNDFWKNRFSVFQCKTPDSNLDNMTNTWNPYQCNVSFHWSRFASFIEVGGREGLGFRDSSQDMMSVIHQAPEESKVRLVELLEGQYKSGAAVHTISPTLRIGEERQPEKETLCSDDHLWLILAVAAYVFETGDKDFLLSEVRYLDGGKGTVYEHLKMAARFTLDNKGRHGLALSLAADWNDCIELGRKEGESVWTSIFLFKALGELALLAEVLGREDEKMSFLKLQETERKIVEENCWDGKWYIRGFRNGKDVVGSEKNPACKIYLEPQSWIPLSGLNTSERAKECMDNVYKYLFTEYGIHLLYPSDTKESPFPPGMKENGAIFCHPNPWAIISECVLGRGDRAFEYYTALCPSTWNDKIEVREAEPYVYCQSIIGREHEDFGKARHPWGTGTGTWAYIAATQYILGIRPVKDGLQVDPCIPQQWDGYSVRRKFRNAWYEIVIRNPEHVCKGVMVLKMNGREQEGNVIPPQKEGTENKIEVILGNQK